MRSPAAASIFGVFQPFIDGRFARSPVKGNRIGDDGSAAMADVLASNKSVTSIDLRGERCFAVSGGTFLAVSNCARATDNEIGVDGVKAWAGLLLLNTTLTSVDLGREWIVKCPRSIVANRRVYLSQFCPVQGTALATTASKRWPTCSNETRR